MYIHGIVYIFSMHARTYAHTCAHTCTHTNTQTHNRVFVFVTSLEGCVSAVTRDIQTGRQTDSLSLHILEWEGEGGIDI